MVELNNAHIDFVSVNAEAAGAPPDTAAKSLAHWYKDMDRYADDGQSTYKNCVPMFDAVTAGYVFTTPCDILFQESDGKLEARVLDDRHLDFVEQRAPMANFYHPPGFYEDHFAWLPRWATSLAPGYSALYLTPINRFDLPFWNTTGVIDNDKITTPGRVPFFVRRGFTGVLPAGTPFMQVIPFKRESWTATAVQQTPGQIGRNLKRAMRFRSQKTDYYRDKSWTRKKYKPTDTAGCPNTQNT